jgi:hypothetical protein
MGVGLGAKKDQVREKVARDYVGKVRDILRAQPKVRIMIPSTETKKTDVVVGINGYAYKIMRDKEGWVPCAVVHRLENAKEIRYKLAEKPDKSGMYLEPRMVLREVYQIIDYEEGAKELLQSWRRPFKDRSFKVVDAGNEER